MTGGDDQLLDLLLAPMLSDAVGLVGRGVASGADVDLAMKLGARHAAGPFERLEALGPDEAERMLGRPLPETRIDSRQAPEDPGVDLPTGRIGVLGTGFMAGGIAYAFAVAGFEVVVVGRDEAAGDRSRKRVESDLGRAVKRGRLGEDEATAALARIAYATDLGAVAGSPLVIEAVVEDLDVKRKVFAAADAVIDPNSTLASNTSSFTIAALAEETANPERIIGFHFFSPVPAMKLVEVIAPEGVGEDRALRAAGYAHRIGKVPVRSGDQNGFIVNRLLIPMLNDAARANDRELATIEEIDALMTERGGVPMGPLALLDLIGLDVALAAQSSIHAAAGDERLAPAEGLVRRVEEGRLGRKSGAGFHEYGDGS